jgi:hypothetical protein
MKYAAVVSNGDLASIRERLHLGAAAPAFRTATVNQFKASASLRRVAWVTNGSADEKAGALITLIPEHETARTAFRPIAIGHSILSPIWERS